MNRVIGFYVYFQQHQQERRIAWGLFLINTHTIYILSCDVYIILCTNSVEMLFMLGSLCMCDVGF